MRESRTLGRKAELRRRAAAGTPRRRALSAVLVACGLLLGAGPADDDPKTHHVTVLSPVYEVDRIYRSMMGPQSSQYPALVEQRPGASPELLWITGFSAEMVGEDGETPVSPEFMCHSNLDFVDKFEHEDIFNAARDDRHVYFSRLFTLSQGQLETRFPPGFGIPVLSNEKIRLDTQVLNLNHDEGSRKIRHKVRIEFVRDAETDVPMKALFERYAETLVSLDEQALTYGAHEPTDLQATASCSPGEGVSHAVFSDGVGRKFTAHYVIPPGRHEHRTLVNRQLRLPYDTTAHHIAIHLHPFAESVELRDLTTGESVYKALAQNHEQKIGLAHVDSFSSAEGIPLYADHDYEVVSIYDNTSGEDQDSMAVMYLYLLETDFRKPGTGPAKAD